MKGFKVVRRWNYPSGEIVYESIFCNGDLKHTYVPGEWTSLNKNGKKWAAHLSKRFGRKFGLAFFKREERAKWFLANVNASSTRVIETRVLGCKFEIWRCETKGKVWKAGRPMPSLPWNFKFLRNGRIPAVSLTAHAPTGTYYAESIKLVERSF